MIWLRSVLAALSGAAFSVGMVHADSPSLQFPLDCDLGETCFIQQYMDRDSGPDAHDYLCGTLSYNDHTGTDIRLTDLSSMEAGVEVLAAEAGIVSGLRNTVPDTGRAGMAQGQECGNGVVIDHGDGWQTQYCHLRQGSVAVVQDQSVQAGDALGMVGYSGNTEFPHLHLSVRQNGTQIDPFSVTGSCAARGDTLWRTDIPYQPGGILTVGFAAEIPDFETIKAGNADTETLTSTAPAIVIWGYLFGNQPGDEVQLTIFSPDGSTLHNVSVPLDRQQAQLFRATGLRARPGGWVAGDYTGEVRLLRNGVEIDRQGANLTIH